MTSTLVTIDRNRVVFTVEALPEDIPVRGNAMASGDDTADQEAEDSIISSLESGNEWAWCVVKVTARVPGVDVVEGVDYLGACSYASAEDFKQGGYLEQMQDSAYAELCRNAEAMLKQLSTL